MGCTLETSLVIEPKFSEESLLAITAGEDITTAMAKTLVEGLNVEGGEQIWSKLNKANIPSHGEEKVENELFYVSPPYFLKSRRRKKKPYDPNQLFLPGFEPENKQ